MTNNFIFFKRFGVNIDITHRCSLECLRCQRTRYYTSNNIKVPGKDMSINDFKKVVTHFKQISFCGQYSDPVHHPKFIEFLKMTYEHNTQVSVHNASSAKTKEWYIKAFQANPNARWVFGIDGLPEESHKYRVNQDGVKLFNIMLESKKHLKLIPIWQFIVFSYNENNLEKCKEIADKEDIAFKVLQTSRWFDDNDSLVPNDSKYKMKRI